MHEGHSDYSPSITARIWTVSDHQWSKALKLQIGFTLRMRNCVSSSWFERLRISDRKFVNHTTEMILWSMILKMAIWAVDQTQGQPKQLVSMDFCSAALERDWSIDCRDFSFSSWCPLVEKAQQIAVAQTPCFRFQIWQPQVEKSDANAICIMYSRFPNQACARISCLFLPTRDFHLDEKMSPIRSE